MVNSRAKGARIEREFAHWLRDVWKFNARRGQQFSGANGDPDVVVEGMEDVHWEVKGTERFEPYKNYEQALRDAKEGQVPVVVHKKNRGEWMVLIRAHDFMDLYVDNKGEEDV